MMVSTIYGRLARAPIIRETRNGNPMAIMHLLCDVTPHEAKKQETVFVSVMAFGDRQVADIERLAKGDLASAMGKMSRSWYQPDGADHPRESWSMMADAVTTSKSARPRGNTKKRRQTELEFNDPRHQAQHDFMTGDAK